MSNEQLDQFEKELLRLEKYWNAIDFSGEEDATILTLYENGTRQESKQPFREHLHERMGYLREAIRIARLNDGVIAIG